MTFEQAVTNLMATGGVTLMPRDFALYAQQEQELQVAIQALLPARNAVQHLLQQPVYSNSGLGLVEREVGSLRNEIERIKRSWPWRISAPLRIAQKMEERLLRGSRTLLKWVRR
jgi:hypothetical protein